MANPDRPNGFKPVKSLTGHPVNMMLRWYEAADRSSDTTQNHGDIYVGDPVKLVAGKVLPANSGDTVLGVAVALGKDDVEHGKPNGYTASNLMQRYLPLADAGNVLVAPAEGMLFEVQTAADLDLVEGSSADTNVAASVAHGSQVTGLSSAELVAATNNDVRVVENVRQDDNDITLANARHIVMFQTVTNTQ